jgi:hypothetical protein
MEFRRIDRNTYDMFQGKGWDNHSRVRQGRNGTYVVSGEKLPRQQLRELDEVLHPTMPITYGQTVDQMLVNYDAILATR